jgi:hypothetical protein
MLTATKVLLDGFGEGFTATFSPASAEILLESLALPPTWPFSYLSPQLVRLIATSEAQRT